MPLDPLFHRAKGKASPKITRHEIILLAFHEMHGDIRRMTLDQYLSQPGVKAYELAQLVDVSPGTITRIRKGEQNLPIDTARRIVAATGGLVTLDDLASARAA